MTLLDRIRLAAAEINGELMPERALPEDDPLQAAVVEGETSLEVEGRRFWLLFDPDCGQDITEICTFFLPLPEYPAALDDVDVLALLGTCWRTRLAIGSESKPANNRRAALVGVDYALPAAGITGTSLRWVLAILVADAEKLEATLAGQA